MVVCNCRTPVRTSLGIWPPLPLSIRHDTWDPDRENENTIAALKLRDRVSEISINCLRSSVLERLTAAMLEPFPALASLYLGYGGNIAPVLPEAILGGSTPSLQTIVLAGIAFPALPKLLLSATRLVSIRLWRIPITGYISPEAMATCLVALPDLEDLRIEFQACPDHTSSSSSTRVILPSLTSFHFKGVSKYLENLAARIDAPIIQTLSITFSDVVVGIPQFYRFLSYAERPQPPNQVMVEFDYWRVDLKFIPSDNFELAIRCDNLAGQVSSMAAVCRGLSPLLSRVECLNLRGKRLPSDPTWQDYTYPTNLQWLGLFHPFITVESLYVSKKLEPFIASALEELTGEHATTVFPKLHTIFLEELQPYGLVREAIEAFVAARGLSDCPMTLQQRLAPVFDPKPDITLSPCSWPAW